AFVDDDRVPGPGQLLGAGQTGRSRADDGHCVSGDPLRDLGGDQARGESLVDDADLDLLDRHRRLVDAEHTRVLTRRRAGPTGEFGEVVRRVEQFDGAGQLSAVHRVVELGDEVAQRAALVAEGHTAV